MTERLQRALGERLLHVTARCNVDGINKHGLMPAADIAKGAGKSTEEILLRSERLVIDSCIGRAMLNHQRPIAQHLNAARQMLQDHSPESWAQMLDHRVFFWPENRCARFARSIARDFDIAMLWLNTGKYLERFLDLTDLSPINSGNFNQGGARVKRGDWLFVPASACIEALRENRRKRGLVNSRDQVVEVSLRGSIPPDILNELLIEIQ